MSQRPISRQQRREALRQAIKAHQLTRGRDDQPINRHAAITREIVDRHDRELAEMRKAQSVLIWSVIGALVAGAIAQLT